MTRLLLLLGSLAVAQAGLAVDPELSYVYPAGGRPENEFEIEVGGPVLQEVVQAVVSGVGVKATLLGPAQTVTYTKKGRRVPAIVPNRFRFKVVVEKDAVPGIFSLRVGTAYRLSEPVRFEIAALPEVSEAFTNGAFNTETAVQALPVCLNGRVNGAGSDRYRFTATKGMTLVAFTEARVLPRGAFRPALNFTDAAGKPCADVAVYDAERAPVLVFEVPQDGVYGLEVKAATGVGGDACVYRVKLGELPLVTGFSPMGAKEGESLNVRLTGCNLAQQRVRLFTGSKNSELCLEALVADALLLPGLRFDLAEEEDLEEKQAGNGGGGSRPLAWPCVVNGELNQPGGRDVYTFSGTAGDVAYVDARAEALGSPLKPVVTVRDSRGATIARGAFNTNNTVQAAMQGRDPSVGVKLPETGTFEVEVSDLQGRAAEGLRYRLRLGPPQPDYRLWMTPASLNVPADGSALATVFLQRIHGFAGEVKVTLDYPPLSISCEGGMIASNAAMCKMTVSTDGLRYPHAVFGLSLTGSATIGGRAVKRTAVPFDAYLDAGRIEVQTAAELSAKASASLRALRLGLADKTAAAVPLQMAVTVPLQTTVRLPVFSPTLAQQVGKLYEPMVVWPPRGFVIEGVQHTNKEDHVFLLLKADGAVMRTGDTGRLILGCAKTGDTNKMPMAVTQSVPYVVK
jgi:hypothetical protein